jgi:hypothetical protein
MKSYKTNNDEGRTVPQNRYQTPNAATHRMKFRLESQQDDFIHTPETRQFSFYQICQFPLDKKYSVRKLIYDETGEIITYRENNLKKDVLDKFLKKSPKFKYTIYPAYDLDVVGFPEANEILTARSQILNEY